MKLPKSYEGESRTFGESIERLLARARGTSGLLLRGGALAGALLLSAPALPGCDGGGSGEGAPTTGDDGPNYTAGKADWVEDEGQRNTEMVRFEGGYWHQYKDCSNRGGCSGVDVFVKVLVKPVAEANLDAKRVGVLFQATSWQGTFEATATANYFGTREDGWEEWHAVVSRRGYEPGFFSFTTWYQDGKGHTYYDDNSGEKHVAVYQGIYTVIRQDWEHTLLQVGDEGVQGTISVILADIDYDKDLRLVWTTDGWASTNESRMGSVDRPNEWYWMEDLWSGQERWEIDVDLPGPVDAFEYAIVYRHGVVNDAKPYAFWDNNGGGNYRVTRPTPAE
jgi:hypothetical protein